ncbi:unnamed protein product [Rotaria socialis]|uniref:Innexin n=2 Tax=Rotaria socialis TaxID=392032 RepID=A0A821SPK6_9BILA|nr:unnamed protein product [Rotaria socialis]
MVIFGALIIGSPISCATTELPHGISQQWIYYIMPILAIFFLLEYCLGFKYVFLGLPIIGKIKSKHTSALLDESFFPQRTWCLISRQKLGGIDETWGDCVLPINVLKNTVFSLLRFWLIFILLMSICGLFQTLHNMLPFSARSFLGHHLRAHDLYDMKDNAIVHDFICKCPPDIILMLRLYEVELGNTLTGQVIGQIFVTFKKNYVSRENSIAIELPSLIKFRFAFISSYLIIHCFSYCIFSFLITK